MMVNCKLKTFRNVWFPEIVCIKWYMILHDLAKSHGFFHLKFQSPKGGPTAEPRRSDAPSRRSQVPRATYEAPAVLMDRIHVNRYVLYNDMDMVSIYSNIHKNDNDDI